jgi:hypothetical protein
MHWYNTVCVFSDYLESVDVGVGVGVGVGVRMRVRVWMQREVSTILPHPPAKLPQKIA